MISIETVRDLEETSALQHLLEDEVVRKNKIDNVRTILVVLSGRSIVYDDASLRQKIQLTYPDAEVYFMSTQAYPLGKKLPSGAKIDLLIDFTGPGHRRKWFWARTLRARTRVCVGRAAGFFREFIYDRVFKESDRNDLPHDLIDRERFVQKEVLALAGVPLSPKGSLGADLQKKLASQAMKRG